MQQIELTTGLNMSRIIYGMWHLADATDCSPGHVQAKIEACLAQGITTFDQADIYGGYASQAVLGQALTAAPHLRHQMQIISKCGIVLPKGQFSHHPVAHYDTSRAHILSTLETSLKTMNIEHVDLLLIHRPDPFMDHFETGMALDEMLASGKAKAVGVSNFKPHDWRLLQSAMKNPLVTNQIEISLLQNQAFTNGDLAFLQQRNIPPMAWSPLANGRIFNSEHNALLGLLTEIAAEQNVNASAVALAWLLAHQARIMPILGTNNLDRIQKLSQALTVTLGRVTWFQIYTKALGRGVP